MIPTTSAEVTTKEIEVVQKVLKTVVVLTMSAEEARVLRQVLWCVGGSPAGPRGLINNIDDALRAAGVKTSDHPLSDPSGVHFDL